MHDYLFILLFRPKNCCIIHWLNKKLVSFIVFVDLLYFARIIGHHPLYSALLCPWSCPCFIVVKFITIWKNRKATPRLLQEPGFCLSCFRSISFYYLENELPPRRTKRFAASESKSTLRNSSVSINSAFGIRLVLTRGLSF